MIHEAEFRKTELAPGIDRIDGFFPQGLLAIQTRRVGGDSSGAYSSLNFGDHVGDSPEHVTQNRKTLQQFFPAPLVWLTQVHGTGVLDLSQASRPAHGARADAAMGRQGLGSGTCVVMTADCLPLLVARPLTGQFAAIHAGWRGLAAGVIEATLNAMVGCAPARTESGQDPWWIWLGPCIGPDSFEVGEEVRRAFLSPESLEHSELDSSSESDQGLAAFRPSPSSGEERKWLADLQILARLKIHRWAERFSCLPTIHLARDQECVLQRPEKYFSYRRDSVCGRMASAIGLDTPS
jgi:YfiH family protein